MVSTRVLVVDDEEGILEVIEDTLCDLPGVELVLQQESGVAAELLAKEHFDLLITDVRMPRPDGVELLEMAREHDADLPVLILTAYPSIETAVASVKLGAADYVTKPFIPDDLLATVQRVLEQARLRRENRLLMRHASRDFGTGDIIGESVAMTSVKADLRQVVATDVDLLLRGEAGTGKELAARTIHAAGARADKRFVPVDCGAIPDHAIEAELFGTVGNGPSAAGLLELAQGGTVFLSEIAELPMHMQAKVYRVMESGSFVRSGDREDTPIDVRFMASTSRDLEVEVKGGRFREDLMYRIQSVVIELPPLRDRDDDVGLLTEHFVTKYAEEMGKQISVSPEVVEIASRFRWPGNIQQLQNVLKRAVALAHGTELSAEDLPDDVVIGASSGAVDDQHGFFGLRASRVASFERDYFTALLQRHEGDVPKAAAEAKIPRGTLYRLLKKYDMTAEEFRT